MSQFSTPRPKTILRLIFVSAAAMMTACSDANTDAPSDHSAGEQMQSMAISHIDAQGAYARLLDSPQTFVLDIRTPREIKGGYIDGAIFANYYDDNFQQQLTRLDKDAPYIVHCKSGGRSTKTLSILRELGFTNITHLDGGLDGWKRERLPLKKP